MSHFLQETVQWLEQMHLRPEVVVMIVSALPVFEIRGGVLVGLLVFHISPLEVLALGIVGNMITVAPLLFLVESLSQRLRGDRPAGRALNWVFRRAERRAEQINRWGPLGLFAFVAIPLPGSGGVTGSLVAVLLRMRKGRALLAISLGVVASGVIMTLLTLGARAGLRALL